MRLQKDISIDGHNIILSYNDNDTDPNLIDNTNVYRLVVVTLRPKYIMSEREGKSILEKHESYCLNEMRKVVNENEIFYSNFDINYSLPSEGCSIDPPTQALIEMERRLDIKLKE